MVGHLSDPVHDGVCVCCSAERACFSGDGISQRPHGEITGMPKSCLRRTSCCITIMAQLNPVGIKMWFLFVICN